MPRINRSQIEGTKCPPKGAIGQALPKGKPMHLVITTNPETGNPMALEIRNQRAPTHAEVPIRCRPWLSAGTIISGTIVSKGKNVWYVFHDIHQLGGRWLRDASHRERLGALAGLFDSIDGSGIGQTGWPRFALATMLPEMDGETEAKPIDANTVGYAVRQVHYKVLRENSAVYVPGADAKPKEGSRFVLASRRTNQSGSNGSSGSNSPTLPVEETKTKPIRKDTPTTKKGHTSVKGNSKHEIVIVIAGAAGPDDYRATDKSGKRAGPLHVSSLALSLKLNQLLRGNHYELYRPPGPIRVLREMSLPCVWDTKHQRWRPALEATGTKTKTTYPVRTS